MDFEIYGPCQDPRSPQEIAQEKLNDFLAGLNMRYIPPKGNCHRSYHGGREMRHQESTRRQSRGPRP